MNNTNDGERTNSSTNDEGLIEDLDNNNNFIIVDQSAADFSGIQNAIRNIFELLEKLDENIQKNYQGTQEKAANSNTL